MQFIQSEIKVAVKHSKVVVRYVALVGALIKLYNFQYRRVSFVSVFF